LGQQGLAILAITADHAKGLREFPELARHDPFDRLIVAQAHLTGMRLLTADRLLLALNRRIAVSAGW
jgi:PIN domain nuclease of toxin-antitoxin system